MSDKARVYWRGELACPHPRKTWQMTRSYDSLRMEYELLHAHELTEEDALRVALALKKAESFSRVQDDWTLADRIAGTILFSVVGLLIAFVFICGRGA